MWQLMEYDAFIAEMPDAPVMISAEPELLRKARVESRPITDIPDTEQIRRVTVPSKP